MPLCLNYTTRNLLTSRTKNVQRNQTASERRDVGSGLSELSTMSCQRYQRGGGWTQESRQDRTSADRRGSDRSDTTARCRSRDVSDRSVATACWLSDEVSNGSEMTPRRCIVDTSAKRMVFARLLVRRRQYATLVVVRHEVVGTVPN